MSSSPRLRSDSGAVKKLERMFKNLDLEASGKVDLASFHTAMYSFEMEDRKKLEDLFNVLDTEKDGFINYKEFLLRLKAGELEQTGEEIMESAKIRRTTSLESENDSFRLSNGVDGSGLLEDINFASLTESHGSSETLSHEKKNLIQRAVVVIRKAANKKDLKDDIVTFLRKKDMEDNDIAQAYQLAEKQSKRPEEKIVHLKALLHFKGMQIADQHKKSNKTNNVMREKKAEVEKLRLACLKAFKRLYNDSKKVKQSEEKCDSEGQAPEEVLKEIRSQVKKLERSNPIMEGKKAGVFDEELESLKQMEACLLSGQNFCSYLLYLTLDYNIQNRLRKTHSFLSEWN